MCQDYDADSPTWRDFYTKTQAKIVYAVTSHTPAEIVQARADADRPDMGLTAWPNDNIRKSDVTISKNYFGDGEIRELNRLTSLLLDIFEDQAAIGRLIMMQDVRQLLDQQLRMLGWVVLTHGGGVSASDARRHAEQEYTRYTTQRKIERQADADGMIEALRQEERALPKSRRRS